MEIDAGAYITGMAVDHEGIVVGGGTNGEAVAIRLSNEGRVDGDFGDAGVATADMGGDTDLGSAIGIDDRGRIVLAGSASIGSGTAWDLAVVRFRADGAVDAAFASDGTTTTTRIFDVNDRGDALAIDAGGNVLGAGSTGDGNDSDFLLARYEGYRPDDAFSDDDGSIFEADIEELARTGITRGCNPPANDHYCPDDPVARGQMAAFLVRALDSGG